MALPQPLHIFRKDLTHLWPETLVVLALFAAFAWSAPSGWQNSPYAAFAPILAGFLKVLMPVSWLVVISRLIHDEPLVGDRQFWTSRPYHWGQLLAAKILYLIVFLYLPFLLMQAFLLKHAGLYPTTAIPALLHNLLLLTVIIVIPLTAIAAVTGTFARMLLTVLGTLIGIVILAVIFGFLSFGRMPPSQLQPIVMTIFIVLPLAALVYQYATRKTARSRILLAVTPLLIFALIFITPSGALIRHAYPAALPSDPKLSTLPDQLTPHNPKPGSPLVSRKMVFVTIPFAAAGVDQDSNYTIEGAALTVDVPGGTHYSAPFVSAQGQINAGTPYAFVTVPLPQQIFERVKGAPADVHLSLVTTHLKTDPPQNWKATLLPFAVPGHGVCSYSGENPDAMPVCRYPFKAPDFNFVSAPLSVNSCTQSAAPQPIEGQGAVGGEPRFLDFDPVISAPLTLRPRQQAPPGYTFLLCPGTQLNFIEAREQGKTRFELDEKHLMLDNYAARQPTRSVPQAAPSAQEE